VALGDIPACLTKCRTSFCVTGTIPLQGFIRCAAFSVAIAARVVRHNTLDLSCCVFFRITMLGLCQVATTCKSRGRLGHRKSVILRGRRNIWCGPVLHGMKFCVAGAVFRTFYTPDLQCTLHTLHSTLYTLHFTVHTPHSTLYTPHFTLYTSRMTLGTPHSTLYILHSALYTPRSILHTLHFTLPTLDSRLHTWHFTLHTLHFIYTPRSTLHPHHSTLHFTLHTLHFTL